MKKYSFQLLMVSVISLLMTSCLKRDLPEMKSSSLNNISDFNLIYKYLDTVIDNAGTAKENTRILVKTVQLNKVRTISSDTVYIAPSFPAGFPRKEKAKVTLSNIVGYANIPDAAIISPVSSAPELGKPGNYAAPVRYEVTAANGSKKSWVIAVAPLPVVSKWEGIYTETGTLDHSTAGLQTCPANYTQELITVTANKLKATAGFWYFNNAAITYFITINADNSVTISSDPNASVVVQQQPSPASTYDPVNKKFNLYYFYYSGGDPANWRKFNTVFTYKP
jgi:uncharacterized protein DUF5018/uncharacterized protein DUF4361